MNYSLFSDTSRSNSNVMFDEIIAVVCLIYITVDLCIVCWTAL